MADLAGSLGLYVMGPAEVASYVNDFCQDHHVYQRTHSGTNVAMSARQGDFSVGSFEMWTAPPDLGGTLLTTDSFSSLGSWTVGHNGGSWSATGGRAVCTWVGFDDFSNVLVRSQGAANYFVLRDIDFAGGAADNWIMIVANKIGTGRTDDPSVGGPGDDGYRCLLRGDGTLGVVNSVSSTPCPTTSGWSVGQIRIS